MSIVLCPVLFYCNWSKLARVQHHELISNVIGKESRKMWISTSLFIIPITSLLYSNICIIRECQNYMPIFRSWMDPYLLYILGKCSINIICVWVITDHNMNILGTFVVCTDPKQERSLKGLSALDNPDFVII